jgi:hypothetical protein
MIIGLGFTFLCTSCSKSESEEVTGTLSPEQEVAGLQKIDEITQGNYTFYIFKKDTGNLVVGYNDVYIQLKNNTTGQYVQDANLTWQPRMHMMDSLSHACPYSTISKVTNTNTVYSGYFIFIMASDNVDYWEIKYNYVNGQDTLAQVADKPTVVQPTGLVRYTSFKGSDNGFYYLAMVNPTSPVVGTNSITAYLYKYIDMYTFNPVTNYTIQIDPRMPDMVNMTSPNNLNLTYSSSSNLYAGKVNLTMTGYWKINLIVKDASGTVLKGDSITSTTTSSNIYFELEF